ARQRIEHRVDHAGLLALDERIGDADIFGDDDAGRDIGPLVELVGARAQHRAHDRLDALERPSGGERLVDQRIEPTLLRRTAADDLAEERGLGRKVLLALDLAAEPVALELGQDIVEALARNIHLVERLHGREPRGAASVGLFRCGRHRAPRGLAFTSERLSRTSASAALAAAAPLSCPPWAAGRAPAPACSSLSTLRMPVPPGTP